MITDFTRDVLSFQKMLGVRIMGLFDAIDKLLEPITKRIFATELGKNIELMDGEELFANRLDMNNDISYSYLPGNIYHRSWVENHKSCLDDD